MSSRVKTALVVGSVFLVLLLFGGPLVFGALVAVLAAFGVFEYERIARPEATPLETAFLSSWGAVIVLGFFSPSSALPAGLLALGILLYLGAWIVGTGPTEETLGRWGAALGGWVFVAYFLGHALWIRTFGVSCVLYLLAVVWLGDTAAFYVGTAFGTHRLAPAVSPKKSVEGAVASLVAGAGAALVMALILPLPHSIGVSLALGVALNGAAQMGDLVESLLKRCAGVKDSGTLFPGHGGVLDRIDGFLPTLPLYAAFLSLFGGPV